MRRAFPCLILFSTQVCVASLSIAQKLDKANMRVLAGYYYIDAFLKEKSSANQSLKALARIHSEINLPLGWYQKSFEHVPASDKGKDTDFEYFIQGRLLLKAGRFKEAIPAFGHVPKNSKNYAMAQFLGGVASNMNNESEQAIQMFETALKEAELEDDGENLAIQCNFNLARVYYEKKDFEKSISYYAKIPRLSPPWLQALLESGWAFYLMDKPNNALGNVLTIRSPFFKRRFFPEAHILEAVSYIKLCQLNELAAPIKRFQQTYTPMIAQLKSFLAENAEPSALFDLISSYAKGRYHQHKQILVLIDEVSRSDAYLLNAPVVSALDHEANLASKALSGPLAKEVMAQAKALKAQLVTDSGHRLLSSLKDRLDYLIDLDSQNKLLTAQLLLGKVDVLRNKLATGGEEKSNQQFIGGLAPLKVGEHLEFWPFEDNEFWKDELGGYVYNLASLCK